MSTVLIADDEERIRQGLRATITQGMPGMSVVAEAADGEEAITAVETHRPDILLVDICMPFLGGLELIERLETIHPDCIIIIVSGHDEFGYAQKALALRVFAYLLKPVDRAELCSTLGRAEAELLQRRDQNRYLRWAREQIGRNRDMFVDTFLADLVRGGLSDTEISAGCAMYRVDLAKATSMVLIHPEERLARGAQLREADWRLQHYAIRHLALELFADFQPIAGFNDQVDNIAILLGQSGGRTWTDTLARLETRCQDELRQPVLLAHAKLPAEGGLEALWAQLSEELAGRSAGSSLVLHARAYIERQYRRPDLSLEEAAQELRVSPGYLSRMIKQDTGCSFVDYLTRLRITHAIQLILDPSAKMFEVAEQTGYRSQQYFSRAFKRVTGVSPLDYRKASRGGKDGME